MKKKKPCKSFYLRCKCSVTFHGSQIIQTHESSFTCNSKRSVPKWGFGSCFHRKAHVFFSLLISVRESLIMWKAVFFFFFGKMEMGFEGEWFSVCSMSKFFWDFFFWGERFFFSQFVFAESRCDYVTPVGRRGRLPFFYISLWKLLWGAEPWKLKTMENELFGFCFSRKMESRGKNMLWKLRVSNIASSNRLIGWWSSKS